LRQDPARTRLGAARDLCFRHGKTLDWYLAHRAWAADITAQKYARERLGTGTSKG